MSGMARTKHGRKGVRRLPTRIRVGNSTAILSEAFRNQEPVPGTTQPSEADLRGALGAIPEDLNWDWAKPRLTPLFERADAGGVDGDPALHVVTSLGIAIGFGLEVGPTFLRVWRIDGRPISSRSRPQPSTISTPRSRGWAQGTCSTRSTAGT